MKIEAFVSLLQFAATLNVALIAADYVNSYTNTIIRRLFKFGPDIEKQLEECTRSLQENQQTLDQIEPLFINGVSTLNKIEGLRRKAEEIRGDAEGRKSKKIGEIDIRCRSTSLTAMSLWLFLYCVTGLFLVGIEPDYSEIVKHIWCYFVLTALIFVIVCFWVGDRKRWFLDPSRLMYPLTLFLICLIISIVLAAFKFVKFVDFLWSYTLIVGALLPFLHFAGFLFVSKNKFGKLRKEVTVLATEIKGKCEEHERELDNLLILHKGAQELSSELPIGTSITHTETQILW